MTQTVKKVENDLLFKFYVKERIGDKEASNFTLETKHSSDNKYLSNKTNTMNQNSRLTTVLLNEPSALGATPQPSKNSKKASLSNMNATSIQQNLSTALNKNLIPNMTNEQPIQNQNNQQENTQTTK
ncbi:hypothetical protein C2G38_2171203 [Gigaspora rosea]|uniref:Uncharacterized protein n=1 Tax=Gigaspora rosea TaxID=44941 RepID=A0A397VLY1_9GLOM|nr:hypothetical protein C2G38_2171203 [Gigaspora rosea]